MENVNSMDSGLKKYVFLLEENRRLRLLERERLLFMNSLIFDKNKINIILGKNTLGFSEDDIVTLLQAIYDDNIYRRKKAYTILFRNLNIHKELISQVLSINERTVRKTFHYYKNYGLDNLLNKNRKKLRKYNDETYKEVVFKILHAPPSEYGINRTTWTINLIREAALYYEGYLIGKNTIAKIIKKAGYRFRKAREVLTSNDPEYKEKLKKITRTLRRLGPNDKFFSIDEFGPFAVKHQTGKKLVPPGEYPTVSQWQESKGWLIITAALELSTNQVTHFYSWKKDSEEMIKLLDMLLNQYAGCRRIYLSWDAASWHSSKIFLEKVKSVNKLSYRKQNNTPMVKLAPLPARAQFLNVIESVFGGLSEAIIKNSDYATLEDAQTAIDMYFNERNDYFQNNPGRAGNKIWGEEIVKPLFKQSHNCKHHRCR